MVERLRDISAFHILPTIGCAIHFRHILSVTFKWFHMVALYSINFKRSL